MYILKHKTIDNLYIAHITEGAIYTTNERIRAYSSSREYMENHMKMIADKIENKFTHGESNWGVDELVEIKTSEENGELKITSLVIDPNAPMLRLFGDGGGIEILRFENNGDIYIKGKLVENDKQVVEGFRTFLKSQGLWYE